MGTYSTIAPAAKHNPNPAFVLHKCIYQTWLAGKENSGIMVMLGWHCCYFRLQINVVKFINSQKVRQSAVPKYLVDCRASYPQLCPKFDRAGGFRAGSLKPLIISQTATNIWIGSKGIAIPPLE
jgi:hypothetical protein